MIERGKSEPVTGEDRPPKEEIFELSLRPKSFDNYIGQDQIKSSLKLAIDRKSTRLNSSH